MTDYREGLFNCTWCLEKKQCLEGYWPYECRDCMITGKVNRGRIGCLATAEARKEYWGQYGTSQEEYDRRQNWYGVPAGEVHCKGYNCK